MSLRLSSLQNSVVSLVGAFFFTAMLVAASSPAVHFA